MSNTGFNRTYKFGNSDVTVSTGALATLAPGSVMVQMGGTVIFAATTIDKKNTEADFFPLTVEYIEKMYARGAISGGRNKREGLPSEEAIVKARQVDHSIRSLFPKSFRKATNVVLTVMAYDQVNDPEVLAVFAASLSIMLAGAPFYGPCSGVVASVDHEGKVLLNPVVEGREENDAEFLITGVDNKALSIEGWGKQLPEDKMFEVLDKSMEMIIQLNKAQNDFVADAKKEGIVKEAATAEDDSEFSDFPAPESLINKVKEEKYDEIEKGLYVHEKMDRNNNLQKVKDELGATLINDETGYSAMDINNAVEYIARKVVRKNILENDKRVSERGLEEIRPLSAMLDVLPTVHGSALFNRGLTQSLSIVTLGSLRVAQQVEDMEGESAKRFFHHYNMPAYATGEVGRFNYHPGRREIGHGAIGENALKNMIPAESDFPYTIRVVSEIMTSNGSTSMAATCASSMALMAAGVPMKEQVAGIGVGLITKDGDQDTYKLLLDIEGIEDFYGDMDFKVTGTQSGITAIQYENKLRGVKLDVLKKGIALAQKGRMQVLDVMNKVISEPRKEVSETAPKVETLTIPQDRIGELIGPGGKNIKELMARAEEKGKNPVDINIDDSGKILVTASEKAQMEFVKRMISSMFEEAEVGQTYTGVIDKIMPYGFFVNVTNAITGLCHISEVTSKQNIDLGKVFHEGDEVNVKVTKLEGGKTSFSMKDIEQSEETKKKIEALNDLPEAPRSDYPPRRDNFRRDSRDSYNRR